MRKINKIIIHCSATRQGEHFTTDDIDRWHRARGFRKIGYHFVVYLDGSVHPGRMLEEVGAHTVGHNTYSVGICYIGGTDAEGNPKDTRTDEQKIALRAIVETLRSAFPNAAVHGHCEFAAKACPSFDVKKEFENQ
ncbi:N-acetylmuramoyl-L-alanine amidase [Dysgonomonas sp. 511]|uniref:N-acetylmuramoyl-L-alanine amidase n=1 Tax=Dysgonomonas sp. 511 TaxID=2302930 RepID=UPI0013D7D6D2|nr:N-acetylmuramoyl-L-alanine amidase [Dysgonomonas sp. 511]NDV79766.1 N-acetylmuramoyl-L-alanine amidase [Dysgonomonas sp. 511]